VSLADDLRGINLPAVGEFNLSVILSLVRMSPQGISRTELAHRTGLAHQTVSNAVGYLIKAGLIAEADLVTRGRGRPRMMLRLRSDARFAVGAYFDPTSSAFFVLNLAGEVKAHRSAPTIGAERPERLVANLATAIGDVIAASGVDPSLILGVGLATPGPVDLERGSLHFPSLLPTWGDEPLREPLAAATGLPVTMNMDVNAAAAGEVWVSAEPARNFALVIYGAGIGTGLVLGGEPFLGRSGNAGFGGTIIVPSAGAPPVRRSESLGHLVTPRYLLKQAESEGFSVPGRDTVTRFAALVGACRAGAPAAKTVLERAGRLLGDAMVTLTNVLDLDEIVFAGPSWDEVRDIFLPLVAEQLHTSEYRMTPGDYPKLRDATVGVDVAAFGAACTVLDSSFARLAGGRSPDPQTSSAPRGPRT
jgi:predicted NBD/HSP70 family sugar kinase